jgi:hypothetical protein
VVVVQAQVHREDEQSPTGTRRVRVAYLTSNPDLLMQDSLQPELDALVNKATKLNKHGSMIATRVPAITGRVVKAIDLGAKKAQAHARLALESASDDSQ